MASHSQEEAVLAVARKLDQFDPERGRLQAWICATVRHGDRTRSATGLPQRRGNAGDGTVSDATVGRSAAD